MEIIAFGGGSSRMAAEYGRRGKIDVLGLVVHAVPYSQACHVACLYVGTAVPHP